MGACASVTIAVTSMLPPQGDVTVVGGVDSTVCNNRLGGGSVPRVLSTNSTPDQASRPRARRRDGFVVSKEGWSGCGGGPITGSITGDNSSKFFLYIWDDQ